MEASTKHCWTWAALCIAGIMMSASTEGGIQQKSEDLAALDSMSYYFSFEIMNRIYNDSLLDSGSPDYMKMHSEVSSALDQVYGCLTCPTTSDYQGVQDMTFRNGSVIAEFTIKFKGTLTNPTLVKGLFKTALPSNNEINGLKINLNSIEDSYLTTPPPTTTTTTTSRITTTPLTTKLTITKSTTTISTTTDKATTSTTTKPTTTEPTTTSSTTTEPTTTTSTTTKPTTTEPTTTSTTTEPTTTTTPTTKFKPSSTTTPKITTALSQQSSSPAILHSTKHPEHSSTSTISISSTSIKSFSNTRSSPAAHSEVTKSPFNNTKPNNTEPVPITSKQSSNNDEGVPGWAIALLVLAAIAILLLLIIISILLIRWCCVDDGSDDVRSLPPQEHTPYMRTTFREPLSSVPAYSPHTPQKSLYPFDDLTQSPKPKPNRTGTYVVNPEK